MIEDVYYCSKPGSHVGYYGDSFNGQEVDLNYADTKIKRRMWRDESNENNVGSIEKGSFILVGAISGSFADGIQVSSILIDGSAIAGQVISVSIDGIVCSYTVQSGDTIVDMYNGLSADILSKCTYLDEMDE